MKPKIPRSPFATRLSGSAKETELRIRNIFQWKKKRPPVIALAAAVLVVAACGSLVGFYTPVPEDTAQPEIDMDSRYYDADESYFMAVQYYDTYENYIEIPMLVPPAGEEYNEAIAAINQALIDLKGEYQTILNGAVGAEKYGLDGIGNRCLFYPTTTDRYINLLFFRAIEVTDLNTGHVFSLVYDKEEKRQVTMEDALALAGLTEQELYGALSAQYNPQLTQELPDAHVIIQDQTLEGFRMGADGQPIFYLTARSDDADDTVQDYVSGADNLYIWSDGTFARYDQYTVTDLQPLVPAGEMVKLDPPLWCQWYFESGEPEGGFAAVAPEITAQPTESIALEAYKAVLQGDQNFQELYSGAGLDMNHLAQAVTSTEGITAEAARFAVVDLGDDGTPEVILWLTAGENKEFAFLILHYQNGVVVSCPQFTRTMGQLKTDGSFIFSGGAADWGFGTMKFEGNTWITDRITYCESTDVGEAYVVDHESATKAEFEAAFNEQEEKEDTAWYEFTQENIERMLGG